MNRLSGLVITYNEEKHIADCLRSLFRVCEDVVVIDSQSEDRTVEIARDMGAKVLCQPFLGDGRQRSFGIPHCDNDWVIYIDADERLDADLVQDLQHIQLGDNGIEAYECRRKNFIRKRWLKVASQYPDYVCRIFNRRKTHISADKIHARIISSRVEKLSSHLLHYSFDDYSDMIGKLNLYSDQQSQIMFDSGRSVSALTPFSHAFVGFIKFYFVRLGFIAGLDGLTISMLNAMGSYFKYAKLIEKKRIAAATAE